MNAVLLLLGLLVLSYLGSFLVTGRTVRGAGLPSGVEYAALGFVLGPHALDVVGVELLDTFAPAVHVALGWLLLAQGLEYGFVYGRRVRAGSLVLGGASSLVTGGLVAAVTWFAAARFDAGASATDRVLLAGGIGAACAETTRHAVRWVIERHGARGPLADGLNELAHCDDLLPLVALAVLFALRPTTGVPVFVPVRDWPAVTLALGLLLGGGAALLLRAERHIDDAWGTLFGVCLIGVGVSARLSLCALTSSFFMGIALSLVSRHGRALRAMVEPTVRPVLLPVLLLAGARLDFRASASLPWIVAFAVAARLTAKLAVGGALAAAWRPARRGGPYVGLSLVSSGAPSMCIGLAFALRFPGVIGDTVLVAAVLSATLGEFVGPVRLRRALIDAREIDTGSPA